MTFAQLLRRTQKETRSLLCIGLDTDAELLPHHLRTHPNGVLHFNREIIDATASLVCAYKLNFAFYEALGEFGWHVLRETLAYIPKHIRTIGDGKRGDIQNTGEHYARALFDDLGFDAATVNPYMGHDAIEPFLKRRGRGVFLLALTSNPGSHDFQRLPVRGKPLYERVVQTAMRWSKKGGIGFVAGATHPRELQRIRTLAPNAPLLIPGVGTQGGDLRDAVRYGCTAKGDLAVINVSRSVLYASSGLNFADAARAEATMLFEHIRAHQEEFFG